MSAPEPPHPPAATAEPVPLIADRPPTLAERIERLPFTSYHRKLVLIIGTCFALDSVDISMMAFLLAPISEDLRLSTTSAGLAASAGMVGMGVGATVAGRIADRLGRRQVLVYSMVLWGVASLLTAFSWNLSSFMVFRAVTGLGLGAELPVAFALAAEFMPADRRARLIGWMYLAGPSAMVLFNALSLVAVATAGPRVGWRSMFVVMFIAAMFAFYVRRSMPESPRWLESRGLRARAEAGMSAIEREVERAHGQALPPPIAILDPVAAREGRGFRELFVRSQIRHTGVSWTLWLVMLAGWYGITTWVGKLLVDRGMSISQSILVGVLISMAGVPAAWTTGVAMDRWGRKPVLVIGSVLTAAAAYAYGYAVSFAMVVALGAVMQFTSASVVAAVYMYTPELFPTHIRGTGLGTSSAAGRVAAVAAPLLIPPIVLTWGYLGAYVAIACVFLAGSVVMLMVGPETKGRTLEEITG